MAAGQTTQVQWTATGLDPQRGPLKFFYQLDGATDWVWFNEGPATWNWANWPVPTGASGATVWVGQPDGNNGWIVSDTVHVAVVSH